MALDEETLTHAENIVLFVSNTVEQYEALEASQAARVLLGFRNPSLLNDLNDYKIDKNDKKVKKTSRDRLLKNNQSKAECAICAKVDHPQLFDVDHVLPRAIGGGDCAKNTWALCLRCHRIKTELERPLSIHKQTCISCWHSKRPPTKALEGSMWCIQCLTLSLEERLEDAKTQTRAAVLGHAMFLETKR
jgi:hypothetical protein